MKKKLYVIDYILFYVPSKTIGLYFNNNKYCDYIIMKKGTDTGIF